MNLRAIQNAFCLVFVSLVTGCSALESLNVQKPTATFRSARLENVTADGLTANFDIAVDNPNSFSVPLTRAQYKLALGGVQVVDDQAKPDASIPAKGSLPVTVPVRLSFQHLLSAEQAIAKSGGNIPYDFDGAAAFLPRQSPPGPGHQGPDPLQGHPAPARCADRGRQRPLRPDQPRRAKGNRTRRRQRNARRVAEPARGTDQPLTFSERMTYYSPGTGGFLRRRLAASLARRVLPNEQNAPRKRGG